MTVHHQLIMPSEFDVMTCRDRMLQVLSFVDDEGPVVPEALWRLIRETSCGQGHEVHYAAFVRALASGEDGFYRLTREGMDWLTEYGRPALPWQARVPSQIPALRAWQIEALDCWASHGRHGVVEAVTGTGKSRVGIEATREAIADGYSVVIAVPTIDLVNQWNRSLSAHGIRNVGLVGDGQKSSFRTHSVLVGTVQSLYLVPPTQQDGRVLLVADECHRYGAGQWQRLLHEAYRRRLGLTATFERNDDGMDVLLRYFGGGSVYKIGFVRAIADGVVAPYSVKLIGVDLTTRERRIYDEADQCVKDCRQQLLAANFSTEPFGAFLHEVQMAAQADDDPTISDVARRYLKAFSQRIEVTACAEEKIGAARRLANMVKSSNGSILFTRRVDAAEQIADALDSEGVKVAAIHSDLTRTERAERLTDLKIGRLTALVAPTILDEGIDVPDVDLGIVMAGSKSRRQMIQRMGRVLRLKKDGRSATFVVVFAADTHEDLTKSNGQEGCLDLILETASNVEHLGCESGRDDAIHNSPQIELPMGPAAAFSSDLERVEDDVIQLAPDARRSTGDGPHVVEQIEVLANLWERGLLTDAEFSAAKAKVLSL